MKKILALTLMIVALCGVTNLWAAQERPDILFIAIDDMNDWTTVFDKNNPIQTPNPERLAARGRFSRTPTAPHPVVILPAPRL